MHHVYLSKLIFALSSRFEEAPTTQDFDSDNEDVPPSDYVSIKSRQLHAFRTLFRQDNQSYPANKTFDLAEQHRLNADEALMQNNYRQAIDLYDKSIALEPNILAYVKRASACKSGRNSPNENHLHSFSFSIQ